MAAHWTNSIRKSSRSWTGLIHEAAFPFLFINGQYARIGDSGYSPGLIDQTDFDTLRSQLETGVRNNATDAIDAEADLITQYICQSTGGQPETACRR